EEAGIVWRMERYGQRMNELMNVDGDAAQAQLNYIEDYRASVRVFKDFISNITAHLGDITTPASILYGEKDEQSYQDSAHYIYEHISSADKD
ncbi:carboxylesterase, partial [Staphylococcus aureus]|nr:carboxylesterase [Staphylococcus aureus]